MTGEAAAFLRGESIRAWKEFGAHLTPEGTSFLVWAPHAAAVSVVGDFNAWDGAADPMKNESGVWSCLIPGLGSMTHTNTASPPPAAAFSTRPIPSLFTRKRGPARPPSSSGWRAFPGGTVRGCATGGKTPSTNGRCTSTRRTWAPFGAIRTETPSATARWRTR
jgi:hypothetical protein